MNERQKRALIALALLGGGAFLNEAGHKAVSEATAATSLTIDISRACVFLAESADAGIGVEVCGLATVPNAQDGGLPITIETGCVSGEPIDPALAVQVMGIVRQLWSDEKQLGDGPSRDGGWFVKRPER